MAIGSVISAQQPLILKAPPMVMLAPLTQDEAGSIIRVYDNLLSEAASVRILNQLVLDRGMRDYAFQQGDWNSVERTIALGEVLGANWVVRPQIFKRTSDRNDGLIIFTAALLNAQTGKIINATPVVLSHAGEARNRLQPLINEISQIITAGNEGLSTQSSRIYIIGDRGPAGGWIFYDKGYYSDGWRYFEIAPQITETSVPRNRILVEKVPGTDNARGSGKRNTELILKSNQDLQIIKAAQICVNIELNWFKDWFLPSERELSSVGLRMNENFAGLNPAFYWSSTGSEDRVGFSNGNKLPERNPSEYLVRAIRMF